MYPYKHTVTALGIVVTIASLLIVLDGRALRDGGTTLTAQTTSGASSQFSSQPISQFSASSLSLASFSASSVSFSIPVSSVSFSSAEISSQSIQSTSFSSFSLSRTSFSSLSLSFSSLSIPRSSFSSTSVSSAASSEESSGGTTGGDQGTTGTQGGDQGTTGTQGGSTGGSQGGSTGGSTGGGSQGGGDFGNFGGLIGIGGGFGGVGGGVAGGSTGGGGSLPKPSAAPAEAKDCFDKESPHKRACIPLIQPLGASNKIAVKPGPAETFIDYFNEAVDLLMVVAVGFCVLWILIGSYLVMISGSDGGKRSQGKEMITWALIGLILVNFAGFFLRTLNSIFFT